MTDVSALELLNHINPSFLDYESWLKVGIVLKNEGFGVESWDAWSRQDTSRYVAGDCQRKWATFHGAATPVLIATMVDMAAQQGWRSSESYHSNNPGRALGWNDPIGAGHAQAERQDRPLAWNASIGGPGVNEDDDTPVVVNTDWVQDEEVIEPGPDWNPKQEIIKYIDTLFSSEDYLGYVFTSWYHEEKQRHLPKRGNWDRTAGELIEALNNTDDVGSVFGDYNPVVGGWVRFNPLDGKGVSDKNVTDYRYALIESDELPIPKQYAILKQLELPIACLIHSGNKSLHAIVRVDADDFTEYRKRVDYLYKVCERNGLELDRSNRNPSKLSRMPGIMRGEKKQFIVDTNIGQKNWQEWKEWIQDINDDLPDMKELDVSKDVKLADELIGGVLREGHKLLLSGPSKAGKSFALIQLCVSIAEGTPWFGWEIKQGRVLYVNLELDPRSCHKRFKDIYKARGIKQTKGMLDVWNLRGNATAMDRLAPKLIRRALKRKYSAIVIDPIYKVLTGDENSAEQMAHFCNQFDKICKELDAATICCHHHSKGAQGQKHSQDRSSGSGVFSRDPDAIIDLIELNVTEEIRDQMKNVWECKVMCKAFDSTSNDWRDKCPQDDTLVGNKLADWASRFGGLRDVMLAVRPKAVLMAKTATAWRVACTVREFAPLAARHAFFTYPVHVLDEDKLLSDAKADGEAGSRGKNDPSFKGKAKKDRIAAVGQAYQSLNGFSNGCPIEVRSLAEYIGKDEATARRWLREHPDLYYKKGLVFDKNIVPEGGGDDK